jgi:hypothetical protein
MAWTRALLLSRDGQIEVSMRLDTQLFDAVLNALGRDDELRRAYLRQRWQGLTVTMQPSSRRTSASREFYRLASSTGTWDSGPRPSDPRR